MRALVTGANGFIGSHLVEFLYGQSYRVRGLLQRGDRRQEELFTELCDWVEGDLLDPSSLQTAVQGCDIVFHAAGLSRYHAHVPETEYRRVNVQGTETLLEACEANHVKTFVYISSIEAVGLSPDGLALTEESAPHPRNAYGRSKWEAERLVRHSGQSSGMKCVIARIATTYGPREKMLFKRMFKPIHRGVYCIFGDGSALIEFSYIKNQTLGIWQVAQQGEPGGVYFISDPRSYSFREVVTQIGSALGGRLKLIPLPVPMAWVAGLCCEGLSRILRFYPFYVRETGRPPFSRETLRWAAKSAIFCDTTKSKRQLGHFPLFSLEEGIQETVDWYRNQGWL